MPWCPACSCAGCGPRNAAIAAAEAARVARQQDVERREEERERARLAELAEARRQGLMIWMLSTTRNAVEIADAMNIRVGTATNRLKLWVDEAVRRSEADDGELWYDRLAQVGAVGWLDGTHPWAKRAGAQGAEIPNYELVCSTCSRVLRAVDAIALIEPRTIPHRRPNTAAWERRCPGMEATWRRMY